MDKETKTDRKRLLKRMSRSDNISKINSKVKKKKEEKEYL